MCANRSVLSLHACDVRDRSGRRRDGVLSYGVYVVYFIETQEEQRRSAVAGYDAANT
jgi:hypothetical protein